MKIDTHLAINQRLCGRPLMVGGGRARVELLTVAEMAADKEGLAHGGFVFALADYAAMLAVNHPYVVLGGAVCKFQKPVMVGQTVVAEAQLSESNGRKSLVKVEARVGDMLVFSGEFTCFILDGHVLA